jgi:hypothetical protein
MLQVIQSQELTQMPYIVQLNHKGFIQVVTKRSGPTSLCKWEQVAGGNQSCANQPKFVYVRNIPTGHIPLFQNASFSELTECNIDGITEMRGLIPGMVEDISDLSALHVNEALHDQGNITSPVFKMVTLPVGTYIYDPKMECAANDVTCNNKSWKYETKCSPSLLPSYDSNDRFNCTLFDSNKHYSSSYHCHYHYHVRTLLLDFFSFYH